MASARNAFCLIFLLQLLNLYRFDEIACEFDNNLKGIPFCLAAKKPLDKLFCGTLQNLNDTICSNPTLRVHKYDVTQISKIIDENSDAVCEEVFEKAQVSFGNNFKKVNELCSFYCGESGARILICANLLLAVDSLSSHFNDLKTSVIESGDTTTTSFSTATTIVSTKNDNLKPKGNAKNNMNYNSQTLNGTVTKTTKEDEALDGNTKEDEAKTETPDSTGGKVINQNTTPRENKKAEKDETVPTIKPNNKKQSEKMSKSPSFAMPNTVTSTSTETITTTERSQDTSTSSTLSTNTVKLSPGDIQTSKTKTEKPSDENEKHNGKKKDQVDEGAKTDSNVKAKTDKDKDGKGEGYDTNLKEPTKSTKEEDTVTTAPKLVDGSDNGGDIDLNGGDIDPNGGDIDPNGGPDDYEDKNIVEDDKEDGDKVISDDKTKQDTENSQVRPATNIGDGTGMMPAELPPYGNSDFIIYFLTAVVLCVILYLAFHNKQKIIALIVEGRHERRRRPHNSSYKKLDSNLDEVLHSSGGKTSSMTPAHIIY